MQAAKRSTRLLKYNIELERSVQKNRRPLIITIIGILEIIIGSAIVISLGFSYVSIQNAFDGGESQTKHILTTVMAAEGIGVVILGLFLLQRSKWAWMVTIAYFASGLFIQSIALFGLNLGVGFALSTYLGAILSDEPLDITTTEDIDYAKHMFNIAFHSVMIFLLIRPSVRNYFKANIKNR